MTCGWKLAAGPKEERISLLQEHEDEEELISGGRLPPKVSSVGTP